MYTTFILNTASSLFLCGVIWVIQLLHYPFFSRLETENFSVHMRSHQKLISIIVIPAMLIELATSIWLAVYSEIFTGLFITALIIVMLIWLSTFALQMPIHRKLTDAYSLKTIQKLVATNWVRTILWTVKAGINIYIWVQLTQFY